MSKKKKLNITTIEEADKKVTELKLALSKEKGLLMSKTKTVNPTLKKTIKKDIARVLTKKNQLIREEAEKTILKRK